MPASTAACWQWTRTCSGRSGDSGGVAQRRNLVEPILRDRDHAVPRFALETRSAGEAAEGRQHGQPLAQPEARQPDAVSGATADAHGWMQVAGERMRAGNELRMVAEREAVDAPRFRNGLRCRGTSAVRRPSGRDCPRRARRRGKRGPPARRARRPAWQARALPLRERDRRGRRAKRAASDRAPPRGAPASRASCPGAPEPRARERSPPCRSAHRR